MRGNSQKLRSAVADAPRLPASVTVTLALRLATGVLICGGLIWLHPYLFGASPLP